MSKKTSNRKINDKVASKKHKQKSQKKNISERKKKNFKKKPFHKPEKDLEEEDFFQIGNSNAEDHSDHHVHHHDHLEAHKHHHKHKESHSHSHDHSNDHVHNHKHTHNHVHNHIHKHNEAHEHTAEHSHTEKHHHKHLEYIDAGGWRRRNDEYNEAMLDGEPMAVLMESRGFNSPEDDIKSSLRSIITFFRAATNNKDSHKRNIHKREKQFQNYHHIHETHDQSWENEFQTPNSYYDQESERSDIQTSVVPLEETRDDSITRIHNPLINALNPLKSLK